MMAAIDPSRRLMTVTPGSAASTLDGGGDGGGGSIQSLRVAQSNSTPRCCSGLRSGLHALQLQIHQMG